MGTSSADLHCVPQGVSVRLGGRTDSGRLPAAVLRGEDLGVRGLPDWSGGHPATALELNSFLAEETEGREEAAP